MGRFLALLSVLVLFGQASGVAQFVMADECERRCAKDDPNHQPEPGCDMCPCCTPARHATLPVGAPIIAMLAGRSVSSDPQRLPTAPDPREIPHVPKLVA